MTKGLQRSLSRAPITRKPAQLLKHIVVVNELAITVDGATGVGFGTAVAGDFPEGNVIFQSAVAYLKIDGPGGDAGLVDTWAGDFAVGTTPADDGTLTAGDVDIVPSTALAAAVAELGVRTRGAGAPQAVFDNTDGSLEVNLNVLVDDADISADGIAFVANGEIELLYTMVGDD